MLCPRLVARDEELQLIVEALDAARSGRGGAIFLLGEAGVGKSRLAREAESVARAAGMPVLWGRSVESGARVAFRPITEALLSAVRHDGPALANEPELRPFLPILGRLIPDWREQQPASGPADASIVLLAEAVLRLVRCIGNGAGCLLVLEDLHWSDSESLAVLEYLVANLTSESILLLATSRLEVASPALGLARSLAAHRTATVLDLERLSPAAVREMAAACLEDNAVPGSVEAALTTSAEGLPLLVEDLLAEWIGAGTLRRAAAENGWSVGGALGPVVPESFAESVRRRLNLLGAEAVALVQLAALLGRVFDWTLLPSAATLDEELVLEHLYRAKDVQILMVDNPGFKFRHALTRQAVLDGLSPVQRTRQSARLLAVVESAHPRMDDAACELAAGLAEGAGDRARAARLLLELGRSTLAQGALPTAETNLYRARPLADSAELRFDIDEVLLSVLAEAGKHERVFEVGEALVRDLARDAAPPRRIAGIHLRMAQAAVPAARLEDATRYLGQARELDASRELEARIAALAAHVAIDQRRYDEARRLAQTALDSAERTSEPEVACESLIVLGRLERIYDLDRAEEAFERAHRVAEAHGLTLWRSRALHELGTIDLFRDCSPRRLLQARSLAEGSGALATVASVDIELAPLYTLRFELDESLAAAKRALEAGRRFHLRGIASNAVLFCAENYALRMDWTNMERMFAELAPSSPDEALYFGLCRNAFAGEASLCEDRRTKASRYFAAAVEMGRRMTAGAPSPAWGEWTLLWSLENRQAATATNELPPDWAMVQPVNRAFVQYASAIRLGNRGEGHAAAEAVTDGDRILASMPWYFHIARRLLAEAAIEDGWGTPADWLRDAEAFFDRHGYAAVASACRSLLRKCGAPLATPRARSSVPGPFASLGVSEREVEVLTALAEGLSNKEIAARLYVSPKTVEKHVASLMGKLEVRSRAQLGAIAATRMGDADR